MLEPPPHLSHALSSMYELMHRCMKKKKGKENVTLGGGSGGGLIGPRNAAQSTFRWVRRNPPEISLI